MAPGAHQHARFVFGGVHDFGILRLHENGHPVVLLIPIFVIGGERYENVIILRLPEGAADFRSYADHFVGVGARADRFSHRIAVRPKFLNHVGADEGYRRMMQLIAFGEKTSRAQVHVADVRVVGGDTGHVRIFQQDVSRAHVHVAIGSSRHMAGGFHIVAETLVLIDG